MYYGQYYFMNNTLPSYAGVGRPTWQRILMDVGEEERNTDGVGIDVSLQFMLRKVKND